MARRYSPPQLKASAARSLRVKVGKRVDATTAQLVQAYAAAWQQSYDELLQAVTEAEVEAYRLGRPGPAAYRTARLQASLDELTNQLRALGQQSGVTVANAVAPVVTIPVQVTATLGALRGASFNMPPALTMAAIVQRTTSKIASDYLVLSGDAEEALRQSLVRAVMEGKGPRDVARDMVHAARIKAAARYGLATDVVDELRRQGVADAIVSEIQGAFAGGRARALNLARTELIDASRAATTASYVAAGMVTGWRWVSALDSRTCPACWAMHNTVWPTTAHQDGHQQCRCTQVPILADEELAESDMGDPDELLRKALASGTRKQRDQLRLSFGRRRLQYLAEGGSVTDMAVRRDNPGWRPGHYVKPVAELTAVGT